MEENVKTPYSVKLAGIAKKAVDTRQQEMAKWFERKGRKSIKKMLKQAAKDGYFDLEISDLDIHWPFEYNASVEDQRVEVGLDMIQEWLMKEGFEVTRSEEQVHDDENCEACATNLESAEAASKESEEGEDGEEEEACAVMDATVLTVSWESKLEEVTALLQAQTQTPPEVRA
jgi:hypothetical protein